MFGTGIAFGVALAVSATSMAPSHTLDEVVDMLVRAERLATDDPPASIAPLQAAIDAVPEHGPSFAEEGPARRAYLLALLAVARSQLLLDNREGAEAAMDRALRVAGPNALPTDTFGPSLGRLHEARAAARRELQTGTLSVRCNAPCRVVVDEHLAEPGAHELTEGPHHVWVGPLGETRAPAPIAPVLRIVGITRDAPLTVTWGPAHAPAGEATAGTRNEPKATSTKQRRTRAVAIAALSIGLGLVAGGAWALAADENCPRRDGPQCTDLFETTALGWSLVGAGAALSTAGTITLVVDARRRQGPREATALLTWSRAF